MKRFFVIFDSFGLIWGYTGPILDYFGGSTLGGGLEVVQRWSVGHPGKKNGHNRRGGSYNDEKKSLQNGCHPSLAE